MEHSSATSHGTPHDQRRSGLFQPIALLIAGSLLMLVIATFYLIGQMGSGARDYEQTTVAQSWRSTVDQYATVLQTLARQDRAAEHIEHHDSRWIEQAMAAPLRAVTGASSVRVSLAPPTQPPGHRVLIAGGAPQLVLGARITGKLGPRTIEATLPIDGALIRQFGQHHGLSASRVLASTLAPEDDYAIP